MIFVWIQFVKILPLCIFSGEFPTWSISLKFKQKKKFILAREEREEVGVAGEAMIGHVVVLMLCSVNMMTVFVCTRYVVSPCVYVCPAS